MKGRTEVLSVHRLRRVARRKERVLTDKLRHALPMSPQSRVGYLEQAGLPSWARGVRVERAGLFQHAVVATEHAGH